MAPGVGMLSKPCRQFLLVAKAGTHHVNMSDSPHFPLTKQGQRSACFPPRLAPGNRFTVFKNNFSNGTKWGRHPLEFTVFGTHCAELSPAITQC